MRALTATGAAGGTTATSGAGGQPTPEQLAPASGQFVTLRVPVTVRVATQFPA